MANRHQPLLGTAIIVSILFLYSLPTYGQLSASTRFKLLLKDFAVYNLASHPNLVFNQLYKPVTGVSSTSKVTSTEETENHLLDNLEEKINKPQERKLLLNYLKSLNVENVPGTSQAKAKFYYHLANAFARLRLYPLAMKCFLKTIPKKEKEPVMKIDSLQQQITTADTDQTGIDTKKYLSINSKDDSLINQQALVFAPNNSPIKSKAITYHRIHETFDDGKKAIAYAMLFHVKQPVRGKRKIFVFNNVGHTFITLIKYNSDSTYASLSFGFYPKKNNVLSATPLIPSTSSVFKDDSGHEWDEVLGKFISRKMFEKIQGLVLNYDGVKYNLSKNNCTDFGIKAAELAGINIQETYGTWPLGKGNNPATTGQSILEGKFNSIGPAFHEKLFVDSVPLVNK